MLLLKFYDYFFKTLQIYFLVKFFKFKGMFDIILSKINDKDFF